MFTGQLNRTESFEFVNQLLGRGNPVHAEDSGAVSTHLYTRALSLAGLFTGRNHYPGVRAIIDNGFGLPATDDYGGPDAASKPVPGQTDASGEETWQILLLEYNHLIALGAARERQFNDQDNEQETPDHSSGMGRLTSRNRTAQVEPPPDAPSAIHDADRLT